MIGIMVPGLAAARILVKARVLLATCILRALFTIVIEIEGEVDGELHASNVAIKGRFRGQITGGTVKLHSGAWVHGDIAYENLSIESGAEVDGKFNRQPFAKV